MSACLLAVAFAVACGQDDATDTVLKCEEDTGPLPTSVPTYSEPAWSPDGRKIAFSIKSTVGPFGVYRQYIHVATAGEPEAQRLTEHEPSESIPSWSPSGEQISFLSNDEWFVFNVDGSGLHRLPTAGVWSPDGKRIAFMEQSNEQAWIRITDADEAELNIIDVGAFSVARPIWSPDGRQIAFIVQKHIDELEWRWQLWASEVEGSAATQLASVRNGLGVPAWAPDSKRIAFSLDGDIALINSDGSGLATLASPAANDASPVWSPDAKHIAFVSERATGSNMRIWVMDADGSRADQVSNAPWGEHRFPAWSPDGRWIAFSSVSWTFSERIEWYPGHPGSCVLGLVMTASDSGIYLVRPDGSEQVELTGDSEGAIEVDWTVP